MDADRENLSGLETEEMQWYEYQRYLIDQISLVTQGIELEGKHWKERMEAGKCQQK